MTHESQLTRRELQCLRALWELKEATVAQVHHTLEETSDLEDLVQAFGRLEVAGVVESVPGPGGDRVYRPAAEPERVIQREIRRLLDTLFDGEAGPLVAHLADMEGVSRADLRAAAKLLEDSESGDDD